MEVSSKLAVRRLALRMSAARQIRPAQLRVGKIDALKKCARQIHAHERNMIGVEVLERVDSAAAAALALGGVDHLPCLIMFLLEPVPGSGK